MAFLAGACTNNTSVAIVLGIVHHLRLYATSVYDKELAFLYRK